MVPYLSLVPRVLPKSDQIISFQAQAAVVNRDSYRNFKTAKKPYLTFLLVKRAKKDYDI